MRGLWRSSDLPMETMSHHCPRSFLGVHSRLSSISCKQAAPNSDNISYHTYESDTWSVNVIWLHSLTCFPGIIFIKSIMSTFSANDQRKKIAWNECFLSEEHGGTCSLFQFQSVWLLLHTLRFKSSLTPGKWPYYAGHSTITDPRGKTV